VRFAQGLRVHPAPGIPRSLSWGRESFIDASGKPCRENADARSVGIKPIIEKANAPATLNGRNRFSGSGAIT
jgi:hypothetical protein